MAINNLKKAKVNSLKKISRDWKRQLGNLIKLSGFYRAKSEYLFGLANFILKDYGN